MPIDPTIGANLGTLEGSAQSIADIARRVALLESERGGLAPNAIVNTQLSPGSVQTGTILAGSIVAGHISAGAITTPAMTAGSINADRLVSGSITATQIAAHTITATQIAAATITAAEIAAGTITAAQIAAGTIVAGNIAAGTITASQIAASTIVAANIAAGTITAAQIAAGTITATQIAAGTIVAGNITAATITGSLIAAGTITATNIASATITATQIAANTITGSLIAASTITATNIAAGTITGSLIAAATITGSNIVTSTITAGLISVSNLAAISANLGTITAGTVTGATVQTASSGARVILDSTGIRGKNGAGTDVFFFDVSTGTLTLTGTVQSGSVVPAATLTGQVVGGQIANNSITGAHIVANTITASDILAGTITGTEIAAATINATNIVANTITAGQIATGTITATQIATGTITATQIATGTITATQIASGTITGTQISATAIDAMTITGATFRTSATNPKVQMDASGINAYDSFGDNIVSLSPGGGLSFAASSSSFSSDRSLTWYDSGFNVSTQLRSQDYANSGHTTRLTELYVPAKATATGDSAAINLVTTVDGGANTWATFLNQSTKAATAAAHVMEAWVTARNASTDYAQLYVKGLGSSGSLVQVVAVGGGTTTTKNLLTAAGASDYLMLASTQTVTGDKTLSGTTTFTGSIAKTIFEVNDTGAPAFADTWTNYRNFLANWHFETNTTSWTTGPTNWLNSGTLTRDTGITYQGAGSLKCVTTGQWQGFEQIINSTWTVGTTYRFYMWARTSTGSAAWQQFAGRSDGLSSNFNTATPTVTTTWQKFSIDWTPNATYVGNVSFGFRNPNATSITAYFDSAEAWTVNGNNYAPARYWKSPFGVVQIEGLLKGGTATNTMWVMPAGYLPAHIHIWGSVNHTGAALVTNYLQVAPAGSVISGNMAGTSGGWVGLLNAYTVA